MCVCVSVSFGFKFLLIAICATMRRSRPHTLPDPPHTRCSRETPTPPSRFQPDDLTLRLRLRLRSWAVKGHTAEPHLARSAPILQRERRQRRQRRQLRRSAIGLCRLRPLAGRRRRCFESSFCVFTRIWYIFFSWVHFLLLLVLWGRFGFCSRGEAKSAPIF